MLFKLFFFFFKSINLCLFVAKYIYNIENKKKILFYHYLLIRFYNRDAAKDPQEGHQVQVTKSATYLYKIGTYSIIYQLHTQQQQKKICSVKIKRSFNNKANKQ